MKALVTGATGMVGANLVRELLQEGWEVRALVRPQSDPRSLEGLPIERVAGDVLDGELCARRREPGMAGGSPFDR